VVAAPSCLPFGTSPSQSLETQSQSPSLLKNQVEHRSGSPAHPNRPALLPSLHRGRLRYFPLLQSIKDSAASFKSGVSAPVENAQNQPGFLRDQGRYTAVIYGACLFSCCGRGAGLFGRPNHDAWRVRETFGSVGVAGFFCNGEIGPIGARNFINGYTAFLAIFVPQASLLPASPA
jgi:hypothetical protein